MLIVQGDFSIGNCEFRDCGETKEYFLSSGVIGGAVQIKSATGVFEDCLFNSNNAVAGGHVAVMGESSVAFQNCTMTKGRGTDGGAIYVVSTSSCVIDSCVITENATGNYGGGVANRGKLTVENSKIYNNTTQYAGADIGNGIGATVELKDSLEQLNQLFAEDNISVKGWACDYDFEEGLYIPDVEPTQENALLKLDYEIITPSEPETPDETEPDQPTTPEEPDTPETPDTPTEPENPEQPDQPEEPDTPTEPEEPTEPEKPDENTPSYEVPDETPGEAEPGTPEEPSSPDSSTTANTTTNTTTTTNSTTNSSSNSSTDNSTSSTDNSENTTTTDNSRYSTTSDSNNTSTVNNYYTHETQPSGGNGTVEAIVVPVGNGEPIEQTIRIESSSPEGSVSGSLEGMTLNVNVNIGSEEAEIQQQPFPASTVQSEGVSWYQAAVLCLLSAILVCVIKRR